MAKTIAIGDIHGCSAALAALVDAIGVEPDDMIVPLGDYVDRGSDSKGVLDQLIELGKRCRLVPILGNHEEMLFRARDNRADLHFWLSCGGEATLDSYGKTRQLDLVPPEHLDFLESCLPYFETETHVFLHANYKPTVPIAELDEYTIRWLSLRDYVPPERHASGKTVIVGHTPQSEILDLGFLVDLDTGCCYGNWLTALDVTSGQVWQANERGELRSSRSGGQS
jgi:serine/threonine protein phosphatase 1